MRLMQNTARRVHTTITRKCAPFPIKTQVASHRLHASGLLFLSENGESSAPQADTNPRRVSSNGSTRFRHRWANRFHPDTRLTTTTTATTTTTRGRAFDANRKRDDYSPGREDERTSHRASDSLFLSRSRLRRTGVFVARDGGVNDGGPGGPITSYSDLATGHRAHMYVCTYVPTYLPGAFALLSRHKSEKECENARGTKSGSSSGTVN